MGGFVVHHVKKIMKHLFHDHHILSIKKSTFPAQAPACRKGYPFPPNLMVSLLVRVTGLEPATPCSQSTCATSCATPGFRSIEHGDGFYFASFSVFDDGSYGGPRDDQPLGRVKSFHGQPSFLCNCRIFSLFHTYPS